MSIEAAIADAVRAAVADELADIRDQLTRLERRPLVLSVKQAADELGTSESTIRRLIADGHLPTADLGGRLTRIPVSAIEALPTRRARHLRSAS